MHDLVSRYRRRITYAACLWAIAFAAPHVWWAFGIPAGFPGGQRAHALMMTGWRYAFDVVVVVLSALAIVVALVLLRPPQRVARRWVPHSAAWIACWMLSLRGLAGMMVDGTADLIWWPTFLLGGFLMGLVAASAHRTRGHAARISAVVVGTVIVGALAIKRVMAEAPAQQILETEHR